MPRPEGHGFRDIKQEILHRIRERTWPLGSLIPGEQDLAREFGCARPTVNRALRELAEAGILQRKRRAGTRVVRDPVRQARIDIPIIRVEIELQGAEYGYRLLDRSRQPAPDWLAHQLEMSGNNTMLRLQSLHLADHRPYQYEDRWINLDAVPKAASEPFNTISPNEWLVRQVPYTDGQITFSAQPADGPVARHLALTPGDPVFVSERTTWLDGQPVTLARMVHPSSYRLTTRLSAPTDR